MFLPWLCAWCIHWGVTTNPFHLLGGDIFIHAKSSNYSKLFELTQAVVRSFPAGSIQKAEDIYGWTFQEGRDLTGFIDGEKDGAIKRKLRICSVA